MSERILAGRYRLIEQVGVGGMAVVYRAIDIRTGHNVAIKVLKPEYNSNTEYVKRFQREAEAASKMSHHNIVNLLDVGTDGQNRYLVMEFVQGQTLKSIIQEKGRLKPQTACEITRRILAALKHAHSKGIIHRDIKPQNILISTDGNVKVSDFGIARITNSGTLTKGDTVMGSVHYFSPEQARGLVADERSDLYSVGICLYEMLTGHLPYDGDNPVTVAMAHTNSTPPPIEYYAADVPPAIAHVCSIAMEKLPENRYQTASQMGEELNKALHGDVAHMLPRRSDTRPETQTQPPPAAAVQKDTPRRKLWRVIGTVLLALMVGLALYYGGLSIYDRVVNGTEAPDMVGMDQTAAERAAARSGLSTTITEIYHATVPAGSVIQQAPEAGTALRRGDTVVLTISRGVSMQQIPDMRGYTTTEAIESMRAYGMTLSVIERTPSDAPADVILTQYPEVGSPCRAGDVLQVKVSGGSAWVPNLGGHTLQESEELLTSTSLVRNPNLRFADTNDPALNWLVADQSPAAGLQVVLGTPVTLTIWRTPDSIHTARVPLELPESETSLTVNVRVMIGESEVPIQQMEVTPDAPRNPEVEICARDAGECTYNVYIGDSFAYSKTVVLP